MRTVDFQEERIKLRKQQRDAAESDDDQDMSEHYKLLCEDEDNDDVDSDQDKEEHEDEAAWESRIDRLHKGVVVIKTKYEDRENQPDEKKQEDDKAQKDEADATVEKDGGAAPAEEQKKVKIQTFRKIRCYMPQWGKRPNDKRLAFETEREVKMA